MQWVNLQEHHYCLFGKRAIKAITPHITGFLRTQEKHLRFSPTPTLPYNLALDSISIFSFLVPKFAEDEVDLLPDYYIYNPFTSFSFYLPEIDELEKNSEKF